jgi:hypothetical protein
VTGLEPATSGVTGRHSNQLSYTRAIRSSFVLRKSIGISRGDGPSQAQLSAFADKASAVPLVQLQSSTTLPLDPDRMTPKPDSKSSTENRWVMIALTSSPSCSIAIILYQVSKISRP